MTELLAACLTMLAIDYGTTLDIRHHDNVYETNIFLGKHPNDHEVTRYFLLTAIFYTGVDAYAEPFVSKGLNIFCATTHGVAAKNNMNLGLGFNF